MVLSISKTIFWRGNSFVSILLFKLSIARTESCWATAIAAAVAVMMTTMKMTTKDKDEDVDWRLASGNRQPMTEDWRPKTDNNEYAKHFTFWTKLLCLKLVSNQVWVMSSIFYQSFVIWLEMFQKIDKIWIQRNFVQPPTHNCHTWPMQPLSCYHTLS